MKNSTLISAALFTLLFIPYSELNARIDEILKKEFMESGYIHRPLTIHEDKSVETAALTKKTLKSDLLCDMESLI